MRTNRPTLIFSRWTAVRAHCGQYASYRFCGTRSNPNKIHTSFEEQQLKIGKLIQRVEQRVDAAYRETLEPLDTNQYFVHREVHTRTPMVMLLGNHSSGKSTLINSLLGGRNIQTTGVAPTDDGFTVILRGAQDIDEDGPTAVSNPAYGFEGLRDFGQGMFAHFRVKTRVLTPTEGMSTNKSPLLPYNLMLIDTPGMIDTPDADRDLSNPSGAKRSRSVSYDRGYDFLDVVRWFATRCDVVLLMFDPSNPGTTGETLDVLRKSLRGMDHKFIIVFNKVDMFEKAPDFARCYGALCWNLSKVIDRKDLPRIYTMYTDRNERGGAVQHATSQDASTNEAHTVMCRDFQHTRTEVLRDILSAPVRRLDNLLTELDYDARHLHLCLNMLTELRHRHRKMLIRSYTIIVLSALSVPATVAAAYAALGLQTATIAIASASCGIGAMIASFTLLRLKSHAKTIIQNLDGLFEEKYHVQLQGSRAADLREVWSTVRSKLRHAFDTRVHSIGEVRATSANRLASLHEVSVSEIPELRRIVHEIKRMEGVREATTQPPDSPN